MFSLTTLCTPLFLISFCLHRAIVEMAMKKIFGSLFSTTKSEMVKLEVVDQENMSGSDFISLPTSMKLQSSSSEHLSTPPSRKRSRIMSPVPEQEEVCSPGLNAETESSSHIEIVVPSPNSHSLELETLFPNEIDRAGTSFSRTSRSDTPPPTEKSGHASQVPLEQEICASSADEEGPSTPPPTEQEICASSTDEEGPRTRSSVDTHSQAKIESCERQDDICEMMRVVFISGKYNEQRGVVDRVAPKTVKVKLDNNITTGYVPKTSLRRDMIQEHCSPGSRLEAFNEDFKDEVGGGDCLFEGELLQSGLCSPGFAGPTIGSLEVKRTILTTKREMDTIFSMYFQNNYEEIEISLSGKAPELERQFERENRVYALAGAKVYDDGGSGVPGVKNKSIRMIYVAISGPGTSSISLEDDLERLANFGGLSPIKAKARLELLQSPACSLKNAKLPKKALWGDLSSELLEEIPENDNVGCGFIGEELLIKLLGATVGGRALAIQVRIVAPRFGLFKGMLVKKKGIHKIQLPPSMKKAGASLTDKGASMFLLITTNGQHPTKLNQYIGRQLDKDLKDPPMKSFNASLRPLSKMIIQLWEREKVPKEVVKAYTVRAKSPSGLKHAFIVGVADPTGELPLGHIFLTGAGILRTCSELFITRTPCIRPSDGRVLPAVSDKPPNMSAAQWSWLLSLPFGCVIFGGAENGSVALPETIASGDLDGDLYFVCWEEEILRHVSRQLLGGPQKSESSSEPSPEAGPGATHESGSTAGWLEKAQDKMLDILALKEQNALVGKLFNLAQKESDPHDFDCLTHAYNDALLTEKHGTKPKLPTHLLERLPKRWHHLILQEDCSPGSSLHPSDARTMEEADELTSSVGAPALNEGDTPPPTEKSRRASPVPLEQEICASSTDKEGSSTRSSVDTHSQAKIENLNRSGSCEPQDDICKNMRVVFIKGRYNEKRGMVDQVAPKTVKVKLDNNIITGYVPKTSLKRDLG
jgi:hypothetical protein